MNASAVLGSQLVISGFRGTDLNDPDVRQICRYLEAGEIAGVILLRRNIVSPEQLLKLSLGFRSAASSFSPVISIDQEGGAVARLDGIAGFSPWMSAAEVAFAMKSEDEIYAYYFDRARELAAVGINLNYGPVVDLNSNPLNPIIGMLDRSYGPDPETVVRCAAAFVRAHRDADIHTCVKHFPGHGSSKQDSHLGSVDINPTWSEIELNPFKELLSLGLVDSIMSSHLVHQRFSDDAARPISLSRKAFSSIRLELGFTGSVITDDMQMRAITGSYDEASAATAAVNAGNTFLIYANFNDQHRIETAGRINGFVRTALETRQISEDTWSQRVALAKSFLRKA